jgi:hypothetical protein
MRRKESEMETKTTTAKPRRLDEAEKAKASALHIRQVEDRALPARTVLREVQKDVAGKAPAPLFVP